MYTRRSPPVETRTTHGSRPKGCGRNEQSASARDLGGKDPLRGRMNSLSPGWRKPPGGFVFGLGGGGEPLHSNPPGRGYGDAPPGILGRLERRAPRPACVRTFVELWVLIAGLARFLRICLANRSPRGYFGLCVAWRDARDDCHESTQGLVSTRPLGFLECVIFGCGEWSLAAQAGQRWVRFRRIWAAPRCRRDPR